MKFMIQGEEATFERAEYDGGGHYLSLSFASCTSESPKDFDLIVKALQANFVGVMESGSHVPVSWEIRVLGGLELEVVFVLMAHRISVVQIG